MSKMSGISWTEESFEIKSYSSSGSSATSKQSNEHGSYAKKRTRILLLIVLAVIITIIFVTVATAIPFLYLNKAAKQTTTVPVDNNPTAPTTVTTAATYDVGEGGASGGSPCLSHTVINDPSRHVDAPAVGGSCDNGPFFNTSIGGRWIRFIGPGGAMIPTSPPGRQRCGAYLTGWFNGTLPSTSETVVNGTACVDIIANSCGYRIPISVIKCTDFYVYFLQSMLTCNGRYCTI